jgi:pyruvate/2-oxoglutarate dehydrogenase complex dihydrolipoamide dehydrogenase (E3) component
VTLLEQLDRVLPAADPEAAATIEARLRLEGVDLVLGAQVERIEAGAGEVAFVTARGHPRMAGDALLVAAGRRPRLAGIGLEEIGVAVSPHGIDVDWSMRTSLRHVYAAGDVAGGPQFTHYAVWQGYAAARNALFPGRTRGIRTPVPWAVFTDPEVAQVGLLEREARAGNRRVEVHRLPLERVDRAQADGDTDGFLKLVTTGADRLLGATIVSSGGADIANELAVALDAGIGLRRLARAIHVYPTRGYGLLQLAASTRLERAASSRILAVARGLNAS